MTPVPPVTDEEALLAAVAAAPLDDAPRLVYADWLQERGWDEEAEYVRAVVALSHPPEDPSVVERCVALAEDLDADWREAVGGRFEVVLEGNPIVLAAAALLQFVADLVTKTTRPSHSGNPLRLKTHVTYEDALGFLAEHREAFLFQLEALDPTARLYVRPMGGETVG